MQSKGGRVKRFALGDRVLVLRDHAGREVQIPGTVSRLRRADDGAWITLDRRCDACPFPADDANRATNVMALPDDCEPAP